MCHYLDLVVVTWVQTYVKLDQACIHFIVCMPHNATLFKK